MKTFLGNSQAMKLAAQITGNNNIHFTNEGFEILFSSENPNQKEVVEKLKAVFTNVKIQGRKVPKVLVNRIEQKTNGLTITEVTY